MPERYARIVNEQFGNSLVPFPLDMPPLDGYLYWHANVDNDPANRWLRKQLIELFRSGSIAPGKSPILTAKREHRAG